MRGGEENIGYVWGRKKTTLRESSVHELLNEVYLQNLFTVESNEHN
jgi:hypothetical protein